MRYKSFFYNNLKINTFSFAQRKFSVINIFLIHCILILCLSLHAQTSDTYFANVYVKDSKTIVMESVSNLSTDSAHVLAFRSADNYLVKYSNTDTTVAISSVEHIIGTKRITINLSGTLTTPAIITLTYNGLYLKSINEPSESLIPRSGFFNIGALPFPPLTPGSGHNTTILAWGTGSSGQTNTNDLADIVDIAAGRDVTVYLHNDGTITKKGSNAYDSIENWENIVSISVSKDSSDANTDVIAGLKADKTVCVCAPNNKGIQDHLTDDYISGWENIIQVVATKNAIFGLGSDKKIKSIISNPEPITDWANICKIGASNGFLAALTFDNKLLYHYFPGASDNITIVENVVLFSVGVGHLIYITEDELGKREMQCIDRTNQPDWHLSDSNIEEINPSNVIAISAGNTHNLYLMNDGQVIVRGANYAWATHPTELTSDLKALAVFAGRNHSVVLLDAGAISNTYSAEVDVTIDEGVVWDYAIEIPEEAAYLQGKDLVYTLLEKDKDIPIHLNPNVGHIYWQPSESAAPGTYCIKVRAADANDSSTYFDLTINLTVNEVNLSPNIIDIADISITAGTTLDLQITVKDSDGPDKDKNILTYSLDEFPAEMSIDDKTGRIIWTPSNADIGTHKVIVHVDDNTGKSNSFSTKSFNITVTALPLPLAITPIANLSIPELTPWISDPFQATGGTPPYTWELLAYPNGMQLIEDDKLSWTPTEEQSDNVTSPYGVIIQVTDSKLNKTQTSFIILVEEINAPPVLSKISDQTTSVGEHWTLQLTATDPDPPLTLTDRLAYSISGQPDGMFIDPSSGIISYIPDKNSVKNSPYTITATVTDIQDATDSCNFMLTINYNNNPPIIKTSKENFTCTIPECEKSNITDILGMTFIDPDGDALIFELANNPPEMEVDPFGNILWSPTEGEGPGEYEVILTVRDNDSESPGITQVSITVNVDEVNTEPYFPTNFETQHATAGEIFEFDAGIALDNDLPQQTLRYAKVGSTPSGAIVYSNGDIIWTPSATGEKIINIIVYDNGTPSLSATNSVKVIVEPPTQTVLEFLPVPDIEINEHEQFQITLFAAAPGGVSPIIYTLVEYEIGMLLNQNTGTFCWTPSEADGDKTFNVKVRADETNSPNRTATLTFKITVNEVNDAPIVVPISVQTVDECETLSVEVNATDPEEQNLTYEVISIESDYSPLLDKEDACFEGSIFKWTTCELHGPGRYKATIRVTDEGGIFTQSSFNIGVREVNNPPRFTSQTSFIAYQGHTFTTTLTAEDDDIPIEKLIFSKPNSTSALGLTLHPYTGVISWAVPISCELGTIEIPFSVTDSNGGTSTGTLYFTVKEWSEAPDVQSSSITDLYTVLDEGEYFEMNLQTETTREWKWEIISAPDGMILDLESLKLAWTPGELDGGHTREAILMPTGDVMLQSIPEEIHLIFDVVEVNSEPQIILPLISAIHLNQEIKFRVQTKDSDIPVQTVKLELLSPLPVGASYEDGVFRWRPTSLDQFNNSQFTTLHFRATDSGDPAKQAESHVLLALRENADNDESGITYTYSPSPLNAENISLQWNLQDSVVYTILATTSEPSAEWFTYARICIHDDLIHIEKAINSIGSEWFVLKETDGNIVQAKDFSLVAKDVIGIDWQINPQNKLYYLPFMDDLIFPVKLSNNFITIDLEQNILRLDEYIKDTETGFVNFRIESSSKQKTNN